MNKFPYQTINIPGEGNCLAGAEHLPMNVRNSLIVIPTRAQAKERLMELADEWDKIAFQMRETSTALRNLCATDLNDCELNHEVNRLGMPDDALAATIMGMRAEMAALASLHVFFHHPQNLQPETVRVLLMIYSKQEEFAAQHHREAAKAKELSDIVRAAASSAVDEIRRAQQDAVDQATKH